MPLVTIKFLEYVNVRDELRLAWEAYTHQKFTQKAFEEWYIAYSSTMMEGILGDLEHKHHHG